MQTAFRDLVLGLGAVRLFRLDDVGRTTALDDAGVANGTYSGTTLQKGVPGLVAGDTNRACRFNGAVGADHVIAPTAADLQGASTGFSATAVVRCTLGGTQTIMGLLSAADLGWWVQILSDGRVQFWTSRDGVTQNAATAPAGSVVSGQVHAITVRYTGRFMFVLVDNESLASFDWGSTAALHTVVAANGFAIGRSGAFASDYFTGEIDEVFVIPGNPSGTTLTRVYTALVGRASFDLALPRVNWRQGRPPHGVLFETGYSGLRYGFQLGAGQTATFQLPRTDPAISWVRDELQRGELPVVTIERSDGALPFVGFVTQVPRMDDGDPYATITVKDHWARLGAARTALSGSVSGASGLIIANAVKEAAGRATPPLFLDLALLPQVSPAASYDLRANKLDQFIRALEKQTGWEAFFVYDIDQRHVTTYLAWASQRGYDRRNGQVLLQGRQLASFSYPLDFEAGGSSGVAVGGTGAFDDRETVTATLNMPLGLQSMGGTKIDISQQVSDKRVLQQRADYLLATPENAVARISAQLLEAETDMRNLSLGDVRTVRTTDGFLGAATEHVARIVAMEMHPGEGVHDVELTEVA